MEKDINVINEEIGKIVERAIDLELMEGDEESLFQYKATLRFLYKAYDIDTDAWLDASAFDFTYEFKEATLSIDKSAVSKKGYATKEDFINYEPKFQK